MESKKDIIWINYVKTFCIIGVFFVHSGLYYGLFTSNINLFIHPFYVNAFFFVSGYLFFRKQLSERLLSQNVKAFALSGGKDLLANIVWRLMIPTLLFSIIEFIPSYMLRGQGFDFGTFLYKTIGGCTYWFTAALVVAEILLLILLLTRRKSIWFYFVCSSVIFALGKCIVSVDFSLFTAYPSLPWQYKEGMYAIIFLALGGLYWKYETAISKLMNKYILTILIVLYLAALLLMPDYFRVLVSMLDVNVPGIALSLLATIVLIEICKILPTSKWMNYIGMNTIGFYFMSGALPIVLSMVVHRIMPYVNYGGLIIVFCCSVGIAFIAVYLMNKFAPWLFDLRRIKSRK